MPKHNPFRKPAKPVLAIGRSATPIYMLPPADHRVGLCDVCSWRTEIQFHDVSTGQLFGLCCSSDMIFADRLLSQGPRDLRRPTISEAKQLTQ